MYDLFRVYKDDSGTEHYMKFPNEVLVSEEDTYEESVVEIINCFASCRDDGTDYTTFDGDELSAELDFVINIKNKDNMANAIVIGDFLESDSLIGEGSTECEALFDLADKVAEEFDKV